MARPRLSSSKKTSFGKRTDAEKSFKDKKKNKTERFDDKKSKGFFSKSSSYGKKPSFRKSDDSSDSRPRRSSSRPFGKREEGGDRPFRKSSFDSSSDRPKRFSSSSRSDKPSSFSKSPYPKRDGEERPFRKSSSSFGSRGGDRFEKKPFRSEGGDKPFRKSSRPFDDNKRGGEERPFRKSSSSFGDKPFEKKPFRTDREDKPFRKSTRSFDDSKKGGEERHFRKSSSSYGDKPFEKKPFRKDGEDKPFRKSTRSFDSDKKEGGDEKPFRKSTRSFDSDRPKPFAKRDGDAKPLRKSSSFDSRSDEKPRKFSKDDITKKGERKPFSNPRNEQSKIATRPEYKEKAVNDTDLIRLNKFMANSGVGSRREADEMIRLGLVTVNGETVTEMGHKVKNTDDVRYEGKKLKAEKPVYILLNKPKGFITTTDDPQDRNTVMGLIANACKERVYPVGRLDRNTTGLLLLTNDGDLADKLTHPSYNVKKIYKVELDKPLAKNDAQKIADGVHLEEGKAMVDDIAVVSDDRKTVGVELHIGWNRIVRRIFESCGYEVVKLDRVVYAGLDKKDLNRGQWRFLKSEEVVNIKHFK